MIKLVLLVGLISFSANATTYTRCKITNPNFKPDTFCIEDKGLHDKNYCARESARFFDTPINSKVVLELVQGENYLNKANPYWKDCSAVYIDGRCWLLYGKGCL